MLPCITITIHEAIHPNSGALPCRDSALSSDHAASFSSRAATCIGQVAACGRRVGGGRPRAVVISGVAHVRTRSTLHFGHNYRQMPTRSLLWRRSQAVRLWTERPEYINIFEGASDACAAEK